MMMTRTEVPFTGTRTWIGFALMCLGMFMAILDIQVVATSLPTIQNALAISPEAMSWIQTSYLIAEVIAIPLTGWLTRILSMRWLFTAAIAFFTLASYRAPRRISVRLRAWLDSKRCKCTAPWVWSTTSS